MTTSCKRETPSRKKHYVEQMPNSVQVSITVYLFTISIKIEVA